MDAVLERTKIRPAITPENSKTNGEPKIVRWTRDEYHRMAELGFFEDKRVELIKGEIIELSPMKSAHATAVSLAIEVLGSIFDKSFVVRSQLPMNFGKTDEPEPDVAVVEGGIRDFAASHPKTAALLVEVPIRPLILTEQRRRAFTRKIKLPITGC